MAAVRPRAEDARTAPATVAAAAESFYRDATSETAAALLETSLRHPNRLVRVAAASSYVEVVVDPQPAIRILEDGLKSRDLPVRDVAAYSLARVDPKNPGSDGIAADQKDTLAPEAFTYQHNHSRHMGEWGFMVAAGGRFLEVSPQ